MKEITEKQYASLTKSIYETLMAMDNMGMGEMGAAQDDAERIVNEWMEENNITLLEN